jgi:hypothetical protein
MGPDSQVESGNGRGMAILRAYGRGYDSAAKYKADLLANSGKYGIDPSELAGMEQPVLVRTRTNDLTPAARSAFANEAGASPTAVKSAPEIAVNDAAAMQQAGILRHFFPNEEGSVSNPTNADFRRAFLSIVPESERADMYDDKGNLSANGERRMRNAILASAYPDSTAIARMTESTDDNAKNIGKAMMNVAPKLAEIRAQMDQGNLHPLDVAPHVAEAANIISDLRDKGQKLQTYLQQVGMFGEDRAPVKFLLNYIDQMKPGEWRRLSDLLDAYGDGVKALGHPGQGDMFSDDTAKDARVIDLLRASEKAIGHESSEAIANAWDDHAVRSANAQGADTAAGEHPGGANPADEAAGTARGRRVENLATDLFDSDTARSRRSEPVAAGPGNAGAGVAGPVVEPLPPVPEGHTRIESNGGGTAYDVPNDVTGARNALTEQERAERNLTPVERQAYTTMGKALTDGKAALEVDPERGAKLASEVAETPRPLNATEVGILGADRARLATAYDATSKALDDANKTEDKATQAELRARLSDLSSRLDTNDQALVKGGREQSAAFAARQMFVANDGSLADVIQRAQRMGGKPIAQDSGLYKRFQALTDQFNEATAKVDRLTDKLRKAQRDSGKAPREASNPRTREFGASNKLVSKAEGEAAIDAIKARLSRQQISSVLGPDILPDAIKAGAYLIEGGLREFGAWSKAMLEHIPGMTPGDLQTLWTNARSEINERAARTVKPPSKVLVDKLANRIGRDGATEMVNNLNESHPGLLDKMLSGETLTADERGAIAQGYRENAPAKTAKPEPLAAMKAVSDALKETSDEARISKQIAALQEELRTGKPAAPASAPKPVSPELQAMKDQRDALSKGASRSEIRQRAILDRQIADLQKQIDTGKFKQPETVDRAAFSKAYQDAVAERNRLQQEIRAKIADQRPKTPADYLLRWQRMSLLSGVSTLAKLSAAATGRVITSPIEEMIGGAVGKLLPGLAAKAPVEGKFIPAAEIAALRKLFTPDTLKDMVQKVRTGSNSLDDLYGQGEHAYNPALDFFGGLHGALKTPAQRATFGRAFEKIARSLPAGTDTTDPQVQMEIGTRAYLESKRAILMNDNAATDIYKGFLQAAAKQGKVGKGVATVSRVLMPIVKVPTNFVGEIGHYVGGLPEGVGRIIAAKGIEGMTPEQADATMRAFKKGGLGLGLVALGYYGKVQAGGYYQQGKPNPNGLKPEEIKIGNFVLPHMLAHTPALEAIQWGATLARVMSSTKGGTADKMGEAARVAGLGTAEQVPFVNTPLALAKATENTGEMGKAAGKVAQTLTEPQLLQQAASHFDTDKAGQPVQRSPKGFTDQMKMGVPLFGLRQQVPVKAAKGGGRANDPMRAIDNLMRMK